MKVLWIYIVLWLISFATLMLAEDKFHKKTDDKFTTRDYTATCTVCSFFLLGIFYILATVYDGLVWFFKRVIFSIVVIKVWAWLIIRVIFWILNGKIKFKHKVKK